MLQSRMNQDQPFFSAFFLTSFSPELTLANEHYKIQMPNYVSDLLITDERLEQDSEADKRIQLGQNLYIYIFKSKTKQPITKISNIEVPQIVHEQVTTKVKNQDSKIPKLVIERTLLFSKNTKIIDIVKEQNENTENNQFQDQFNGLDSLIIKEKLQINGNILIIISSRVSQQSEKKLPLILKGISEPLYYRHPGEIDLQHFPLFCFPKGISLFLKNAGIKIFNFTILTVHQERIYCTSLKFRQKLSKQQKQSILLKFGYQTSSQIYTERALTLISKNSCTDQVTHVLQKIFFQYLQRGQKIFRQQMKNLGDYCRIQEKSRIAHFELDGVNIGFKLNTSYPHTSIDAIYAVFKFLDVENILQIFEALMMEQKVFFISECSSILGFAIQAFQSFLFPLFWVHHIIPQITPSLLDYVQAPMAIIFGASNDLIQKVPEEVLGVFVYLDKNKVINKTANLPKLRPNLRKLLATRLEQFSVYDKRDVHEYLQNTQNISLFKTKNEQDPRFNAYKIRNIFFQLLVYILKDYKLYYKVAINKDTWIEPTSMKNIYDFQALKKSHRRDTFMPQFYETDLFRQLIESKLYEPKNKWNKTLDRAIRKISKEYKNQIIKEQSDNQSDHNETDGENQEQIPRGCLNMIHIFSKQSEEEKNSSPSPRKSFSPSPRFSDEKHLETTKPSQNEHSEQGELDRKNSISTNAKNSISDCCGELDEKQNNKKIVYVNEEGEEEEEVGGFCFYISYPYRKAKETSAAKWTKKQFLKIKFWTKKRDEVEEQIKKEQIKEFQKEELAPADLNVDFPNKN